MIERKERKDTAYREMLEAMRNARRCVFCDLECKGIARYFGSLLYEKMNAPGFRRAPAISRGFCPRHAYMMVRLGDGLGTAIFYSDQVRIRLHSLERAGRPRRRSGASLSAAGHAGDTECPACLTEARMRAAHAGILLRGLRGTEMREAFSASAGLCFPHFSIALEQAEDPHVKSELLRVQRDKMEVLSAELQQLISRHNHRRMTAGLNDERDSWLRAVAMVSGVKEVF